LALLLRRTPEVISEPEGSQRLVRASGQASNRLTTPVLRHSEGDDFGFSGHDQSLTEWAMDFNYLLTTMC